MDLDEETARKIEELARYTRDYTGQHQLNTSLANETTLFETSQPHGLFAPCTEPHIFFVVDTNVLLSDLDYIQALASFQLDAVCPLPTFTIIIPWVVVSELDALKGDDHSALSKLHDTVPMDMAVTVSLGVLVRRSVRFLDEQTATAVAPIVKIQRLEQVRVKLSALSPTCNDDRILHCCFVQAGMAGPQARVVLLTVP